MGGHLTEGGVPSVGIVQASTKSNMAIRASARFLRRLSPMSSVSSVAEKLSHMALSYASPIEPMEGRTPAFLHGGRRQ